MAIMDVSGTSGKFGFDIDKQGLIAELRKTADLIEAEIILPSSVSYTVTAARDDYRIDTLTIQMIVPREIK